MSWLGTADVFGREAAAAAPVPAARHRRPRCGLRRLAVSGGSSFSRKPRRGLQRLGIRNDRGRTWWTTSTYGSVGGCAVAGDRACRLDSVGAGHRS